MATEENKHRIKNLVFDFGKVLVDYDFIHIIRTFFTDRQDEEEFVRLFTDESFMDRCDKEDEPFIEIIRDMQQRYPQFKVQAQAFYDHYVDFVTGEVPGMRENLKMLKAEGFKLYGLTNWSSKVHEVMQRFPIFSLLDGRLISSEEHLIKPDPAIYRRFCEKFQVKPEECLFTDDKPKNIAGAKSIGMHAIVFQHADQYMQELRNICLSES